MIKTFISLLSATMVGLGGVMYQVNCFDCINAWSKTWRKLSLLGLQQGFDFRIKAAQV